mmetsp:Transcript_67598/g.187470  ORF Transcript_67598/g.187470 Transcript_67598/m.187470 type:complete len:203 (+) Transcript_67598:3-611(+)
MVPFARSGVAPRGCRKASIPAIARARRPAAGAGCLANRASPPGPRSSNVARMGASWVWRLYASCRDAREIAGRLVQGWTPPAAMASLLATLASRAANQATAGLRWSSCAAKMAGSMGPHRRASSSHAPCPPRWTTRAWPTRAQSPWSGMEGAVLQSAPKATRGCHNRSFAGGPSSSSCRSLARHSHAPESTLWEPASMRRIA